MDLVNQNELSRLKNILFGAQPGIVFSGTPIGPYLRDALFPEERACLEGMAGRRKKEWAAGRGCARTALRLLGANDYPLLSDSKRAPLWPPGFMGSIAHTRDHVFVAIARSENIASIGIDVEFVERLSQRLWSKALVDEEIQQLEELPPHEKVRQATLLFSVKEAFYKYQSPLTESWLGLRDACARLNAQIPNTVTIEILKNTGPWPAGKKFKGHYAWSGPYVFSAFC